jgi:oligopeptidase A
MNQLCHMIFSPTMNNPLLQTEHLPAFDRIEPEHIAPAIEALLGEADAALGKVTDSHFPASWMGISQVLDVATERLAKAWGAVSHLSSVADTPELRSAYNALLPRVTDFWTRLASDEGLYAKYKAIDPGTLQPTQARAHANALRGFVLGGAELQGAQKARFSAIQERMAELTQKFSENVLDATDSYALFVDREALDGVPADVQAAAAAAAQADGKAGYKLTLKMPCYLPVMQFAHSRTLREQLYRAHVTRASDQADAAQQQYDNSAIMQEILALRLEEAQLLGYSNYAELSLVPKMADSPEKVLAFLRELAVRARPFAERDLADLHAFAKEHMGITEPLAAWDIPYVSEKLKEARYSFSEQEVKAYFTAPKVLMGLLKLVGQLFDVRVSQDKAPTWHPDVVFYRLERQGQLIGQFYLDPSARQGKRGGAWMDDVQGRWLRPDTQRLQTPIAHLVCNFADGVDGQPALLTHDDVITLFHECGHGLHHLLTQVDERDVSGINGVEWDAVELPSQFMENFCWEQHVLLGLTAHVKTGEPLPGDLFAKMLSAKNFQSGLQTLRQIEFALLDMRLHMQTQAGVDVQALLNEVRQEVAVATPPAFNRMAHSFSHIFAGGYAAGYYSYKWAEVLSADAYAAFKESAQADGRPAPETARRYLQEILEVGGSREALHSFKAFRGREPSIAALLEDQGMAMA